MTRHEPLTARSSRPIVRARDRFLTRGGVLVRPEKGLSMRKRVMWDNSGRRRQGWKLAAARADSGAWYGWLWYDDLSLVES